MFLGLFKVESMSGGYGGAVRGNDDGLRACGAGMMLGGGAGLG